MNESTAHSERTPLDSRASQLAAAVAGLAFVAYPGLRPWSSEQGQEFAEALSRPAWPLTHLLAVLGFVMLAVLLRHAEPGGWRGLALPRVEGLAWFAAAFLLPYYGAEGLGMHALGQQVMATGDLADLAVVEGFRFGPIPLAVFAVGLLSLGVVGVLLLRGLWDGGTLQRLGAGLVALGLLTFIPQFFAPASVRVAHGVVLGLGFLLLAASGVGRTRRAGH